MRIETLRLPAFGPFTDKELCLASRKRTLHLIHGPNEAGKSTLLRAMNNLLFGFPHQTPDAHLHPAKTLAVGATLRLADGRMLDLIRHKRRKNDLLDEHGRVVEQASLTSLMGGISQELFGQMFGIDQEGLHRGAEGLLKAEGDLGQALFAAASGIADLRTILNELEARQSALFRPRAGTSSIHQSVGELATLSRTLRESCLKPAHWKRLQQELKEQQARQRELLDEMFTLDANMARFQRYRDALRHIDLREEYSRRLDQVVFVTLLTDDFTERRSMAQQSLAGAVSEEDQLVFRLKQIAAELQAATLNTGILEAERDVQRLFVEAAAHRKALKDAHNLETRCAALRSQMADIMESLGRSSAKEQDGQPRRLTRQFKVQLDSLSREYGALHADMASSTRARDEALVELAEARALLDATPPVPDLTALESVLAKAADMGNPAQRVQEAALEMKNLSTAIAREMQTMGLWEEEPPGLETLALPLPETVERFDAEIQAASNDLEEARKERLRLEAVLRQKNKALKGLELAGKLPDASSLAEARELRDTGWSLVKSDWMDGSDPAQVASFIRRFPDKSDLAGAYEQSVGLADSLADSLYDNASQVAQAMALRQEIAGLDTELETCTQLVQARNDCLETLLRRWTGLWSALGISPLSAREMLAWLNKALDIRRRLAELRHRESAHHRLASSVQAMAEDLGHALTCINVDLPRQTDYASVFALAGQSLARLRQGAAERAELQRRIAALTTVVDKAAARQDRAAAALEAWAGQWASTVQTLDLPVGTTPEIASTVALALEEIAQAGRERDNLEKRIADIQADYQSFSGQVLAMGSLLQGEALERPEDIIDRLHSQLQAEKEIKARIEALTREQLQIERQLQAARRTIEESSKTLADLCAEAGCDNPADLPRFEAMARSKAETVKDRNAVEERLLELAGGETLDGFIAAAREHHPDALSAELERMRVLKAEMGEQRDRCTAEIGRLGSELAGLDGTSRAAEIAQQINETRTRLHEDVRQYVRLRLGVQVLSREIERYREANQGPVLEAAGRYFDAMTLGSFSTLQADYNEKGDPVIKAVRGNDTGMRLEVGQLSEGTRDQLFLSLRLGGLRRYLQSNPPLPLIVDDILVNFDDQRSAATFRVLAEIASSTQVLFFTHHAHLVHIAKNCLPADELRVHAL